MSHSYVICITSYPILLSKSNKENKRNNKKKKNKIIKFIIHNSNTIALLNTLEYISIYWNNPDQVRNNSIQIARNFDENIWNNIYK